MTADQTEMLADLESHHADLLKTGQTGQAGEVWVQICQLRNRLNGR